MPTGESLGLSLVYSKACALQNLVTITGDTTVPHPLQVFFFQLKGNFYFFIFFPIFRNFWFCFCFFVGRGSVFGPGRSGFFIAR